MESCTQSCRCIGHPSPTALKSALHICEVQPTRPRRLAHAPPLRTHRNRFVGCLTASANPLAMVVCCGSLCTVARNIVVLCAVVQIRCTTCTVGACDAVQCHMVWRAMLHSNRVHIQCHILCCVSVTFCAVLRWTIPSLNVIDSIVSKIRRPAILAQLTPTHVM